MPQPNFQYGKSIFGRIGSSKKAAQKSPIMNYEQLLSSVFSCFHGLKFNNFFFENSLASALKICLKKKTTIQKLFL